MARNVDEVNNIAFVQLTEQEPGPYGKSHAECGRRDKVDLAWEGISREMKHLGVLILSD
jgi:hypothetical protein